jgi:predicted phage terminase large subunit-like protein
MNRFAQIAHALKRNTLVEYSFMNMIRETFPGYIENWHLLELASILEQWIAGDIPRLLISWPPRHGKSEMCSVRLPAYILGKFPDEEIICCSHTANLAVRFNREVQSVISSEAYQRMFASRLPGKASRQTCTTSFFEIEGHRGGLRSSGVNGPITGSGMKRGIIDDPFKNRKEANSPVVQDSIWAWYKSTFRTRLAKNGTILAISTRWHDLDLMGRLLEQEAKLWHVINIPARYDSELSVGMKDVRIKGEPLWPEMYGDAALLELEKTLGISEWGPLFQGDTKVEQGNIINPGWWQYYDSIPVYSQVVQSWDTALKDGQENDYSVCTTWGIAPNAYYLLHVLREKLIYPDLEAAFLNQAMIWRPNAIYVEDKASGISLLQGIRRKHSLPIIPFDPKTMSKEERARASSGVIKAGVCHLPKEAPWLRDYVDELRRFPSSAHDDQVDSTTQFLLMMLAKPMTVHPFKRSVLGV